MAYVVLHAQGDWEKGRWVRVVAPDGSLWLETSNEEEARQAMRPGDKLYRLWYREEREWREISDA